MSRLHTWNPSELEYVSCNVCGRSEASVLLSRDDGLSLVRCSHCRLAWINPRPQFRFLQRLYDENYYSGRGDCASYSDYVQDQLSAFRTGNHVGFRVLDRLASFRALAHARLLDVGCSIGTLLRIAEDRRMAAKGIDLSRYAVEYGRSRFDLDIHEGTIDNLIAPGVFDVVTFLDVIEHVPDPVATIRAAARLLAPDGLICFTTPNFHCYARYGDFWPSLHKSFEHIYYFDHQTLAQAVSRAGLRALHWETFEVVSRVDRFISLHPVLRIMHVAVKNTSGRIPALYRPAQSIWRRIKGWTVPNTKHRPPRPEDGQCLLLIAHS